MMVSTVPARVAAAEITAIIRVKLRVIYVRHYVGRNVCFRHHAQPCPG